MSHLCPADRSDPVCTRGPGASSQIMDIFEGTEQIQQGIVARAISEGRIDPLR